MKRHLAALVVFSVYAAACSDEQGVVVVPGVDAAPHPDSGPRVDGSTLPDSSLPGDDSGADASDVDGASSDAGGDASDSGAKSDASVSDAGADASDSGAKSDASIVDAGVDASDSGIKPDASLPDGGMSNCPTPSTGTLLTFDFTGEKGNQISTAAASSAAGITAGAISRSQSLVAASANNSLSSDHWALVTDASMQSPDPGKYLTFTINADPKCLLDLSSIAIDTQSSNTGPASASVATSADKFVGMSAVPVNKSSSIALAVTGANGLVEVRIYGYAATGSTGTMRVQNKLTVSGTLR